MGQPGMARVMSPCGERTKGSETSQYLEEKKSTEIPKVAASEMGLALKRVVCQQNPLERGAIEGDSPVSENYLHVIRVGRDTCYLD